MTNEAHPAQPTWLTELLEAQRLERAVLRAHLNQLLADEARGLVSAEDMRRRLRTLGGVPQW